MLYIDSLHDSFGQMLHKPTWACNGLGGLDVNIIIVKDHDSLEDWGHNADLYMFDQDTAPS